MTDIQKTAENTTQQQPQEAENVENTENEANLAEADTAKDLRERFKAQLAKEKAEAEKLKAELQAIKEAESDKSKTLEEKLAEAKLKLEQKEEQIKLTKREADIKTSLLRENINPEFLDFVIPKAIAEDGEVDEIIENLKTKIPTAFQPIVKPASKTPSINNGNSSKISREKAMQMVNDPVLYRQHRDEIREALGTNQTF